MVPRAALRSVGVALMALALALGLVAGCGNDGEGSSGDGAAATLEVPEGFVVEEVVDGLEGPTQLQVLDDGRYLVAQLAGDEGEPEGQVLVIDPDTGEREVLFDGLVTPTGVAVVGDDVWVMEQRRLSVGALPASSSSSPGELRVVLDDLPYNGRSEGTLTPLDDGRLLYHTSGSITSGRASDGSGAVWVLDAAAVADGAAPDPQQVAVGFKNAYARTVGPDGTLWQSEVTDGSFDGDQGPDELVAIPAGALDGSASAVADGGWPRCIGDRQPVEQFGGSTEACGSTLWAQALFPAGATPTSVVVSPWDDEELLVALWNRGEIVAVPTAGSTDGPVEVATWATGIDRPQHLVAGGDRLLVVDHDGGTILAVNEA
jgi:glucose/arabinose dehydrogenase